jgi:hypothetical protein
LNGLFNSIGLDGRPIQCRYLNNKTLPCGLGVALSNEVEQGRLNEVCACEEDNNPEIFQLEGVGEALFYFLFEDEIDRPFYTSLLLDELRHKVENNCFIMLHNGVSIEDTLAYFKRHFIWGDLCVVEKRLHLSQIDPFYRTNLFVYAPSLDYFKKVSRQLNTEGKREFFRKMYRVPMIFWQIDDYFNELLSKYPQDRGQDSITVIRDGS